VYDTPERCAAGSVCGAEAASACALPLVACRRRAGPPASSLTSPTANGAGALKDVGSADILRWRREGCAADAADADEGEETVSLVRPYPDPTTRQRRPLSSGARCSRRRAARTLWRLAVVRQRERLSAWSPARAVSVSAALLRRVQQRSAVRALAVQHEQHFAELAAWRTSTPQRHPPGPSAGPRQHLARADAGTWPCRLS